MKKLHPQNMCSIPIFCFFLLLNKQIADDGKHKQYGLEAAWLKSIHYGFKPEKVK